MYRELTACRICGNSDLVVVLDLGVQTLTGVFPRSRDQSVTRGPLRLVKCAGGANVCGLLQLQHTYDLRELYGNNYGYRSGLNSQMVAHLHEKVDWILKKYSPPKGSLIIDIGSNDGTTLKAYPFEGYRLVGIDPTAVKFKNFYPDHIQLISDFFSAGAIRSHLGSRKASVVTSFSMFYDLESPLNFMQEVADILDVEGIWVLEQSYMPAMLHMNAYDTVCHEHLEYYAIEQIHWMAQRCGLRLIEVDTDGTNGGSFAIVAAKDGSHYKESSSVARMLSKERGQQLNSLAPYRCFSRRVSECRDQLRLFFDDARAKGDRTSVLGASTKGNVLLQYCGVTQTDVEKVGEINSDKFGCFTPGGLLPITSEAEVLSDDPDYLLVLPWHFRKFFLEQPQYRGRKLVFPLPQLEILQC